MGEICRICKYKCKTNDNDKIDNCMEYDIHKPNYIKLFKDNKIDIKIFSEKNGLKYKYLKKMIYGDIPLDERYEYCLKNFFFKGSEFEPYRSRFEGGGEDL